MRDYQITYFEGMGMERWLLNDDVRWPCEVCRSQFHDVHHIDRRGMGGSKKQYYVEQLMAICRYHHTQLGDQKQYRSFLYWVHFLTMKNLNLQIDYSKLPKDLFFDQYSDEEKLTSTYYAIIMNGNYEESITTAVVDAKLIYEYVIKRNGRHVTTVIGDDKLKIMSRLINEL